MLPSTGCTVDYPISGPNPSALLSKCPSRSISLFNCNNANQGCYVSKEGKTVGRRGKGGVRTFGNMSTHRTMNTRAADAKEAADIPGCPSWVILLAVCANFVIWVFDEGAKQFGVCFCLRP